MIAKLIVHAPTRAMAVQCLAKAAGSVEAWPVKTNAAFLARAASDADFVAGRVDTGFIDRHGDRLLPPKDPSHAVLQAAARAMLSADAVDPWRALAGFRANAAPDRRIIVEVAGVSHVVAIEGPPPSARFADVGGQRIVFFHGEAWPFGAPTANRSGGEGVSTGVIVAPMPGRIVAVEISDGEKVWRGQKLLVLEAMKMEHAMTAPFDGVIAHLKTKVGAQVSDGDVLLSVVKGED